MKDDKIVKNRLCFKCNKEIKPIEPQWHDEPESAMWLDGVVGKISAGYGSILDGNMYVIAICDDCIKDNKNIEYIGDYMFDGKIKL